MNEHGEDDHFDNLIHIRPTLSSHHPQQRRFPSVLPIDMTDKAPYPGDNVLPDAIMVFDQTRPIQATPAEIFPWLLQVGKSRGGWYLPHRYERFLPSSWHASRSINPSWQNLKVGDIVPDYGSSTDVFEVVSIDSPRSLVYKTERYGAWFTWTLMVHDQGMDQKTGKHLSIVHLRFRGRIAAKGLKRRCILKGGHFLDHITTAPMLAGLKERVGKAHQE